MDINTYMISDFGKSMYCHKRAEIFNNKLQKTMLELASSGTCGNIAARLITPFVGLGALIVSLCLRIGAMIEPIIGFGADTCAAIYFRKSEPIRVFRGLDILLNPIFETGYILRDVLKIGLVAGVGGIIMPVAAYKTLDKFCC